MPGVFIRSRTARLVDQIDGLVRQEPVGDVAVGQFDSRGERSVLVPHLMMRLVPVPQSVQDRQRVLDRRLRHQDRLKPPGQRRILLDVFAVFVQRGGPDHVQLASGQRWLDHVPGVHPAFGAAARADQRVQLVNEDDQLVAVVANLIDDAPHPLLEVTAIARARHDARQFELH
jgi:hypothetical protein